MELLWAAAAAALVVGGLAALAVRARRRRRRRLALAEQAARQAAAGPPGVGDLLGLVLRGSVGLVAGLLRGDDVDRMTAADGTVTLLFCDIADSTAINVEMGDRAWARLLTVHDRVSDEVVGQVGGRVVKRSGDGFMAVLPSATSGVRAAEALREGLRDHPEIGRHLDLRIGVHTGEVVDRDGDFFGANVAMAARVADVARGDDIVVSDEVRTRLEDPWRSRLVDLRARRLKGLPGRHRLWRLGP